MTKWSLLIVAGGLFGLACAAHAEPRTITWNFATPMTTPEDVGGLNARINTEVKTPDGQPSIEVAPDYDRDDLVWSPHLRYYLRSAEIKDAKTVTLTFWIKGEAGMQIGLRVTSSSATAYTPTRLYDLTGEWQKIEFKEPLQGPVTDRWMNAPRLLFEKEKKGQHAFVGPVTLKAE